MRQLLTYFKLLSYMFRSYTRVIIVRLRTKRYVKPNALFTLLYCFYTKTNDDLCRVETCSLTIEINKRCVSTDFESGLNDSKNRTGWQSFLFCCIVILYTWVRES